MMEGIADFGISGLGDFEILRFGDWGMADGRWKG
jgi:hypothetical protein